MYIRRDIIIKYKLARDDADGVYTDADADNDVKKLSIQKKINQV